MCGPISESKAHETTTKDESDFGDAMSPLPAWLLRMAWATLPAHHEVAPTEAPPGHYLTERPREAPWAVTAEAIHQVLADTTPAAGAAGTRVVLYFAVPASEAPWAYTLVPIHQVLGAWTEQWAPELHASPPRSSPATFRPSQSRRGIRQPPYLAGATVLTLPVTIVDV